MSYTCFYTQVDHNEYRCWRYELGRVWLRLPYFLGNACHKINNQDNKPIYSNITAIFMSFETTNDYSILSVKVAKLLS